MNEYSRAEPMGAIISANVDRRFERVVLRLEQHFEHIDGFGEFEARVDQRFDAFEARVDRRFGELEIRMDRRFDLLDARLDALGGRVERIEGAR